MSKHARRPAPLTRALRAVASVTAMGLLLGPLAGFPSTPAQAADVFTSVKVSFQPDAAAAPAGFVKDTGAAFSDASGQGWVRQDSLSGTPVPYGVPKNTRDRGCAAFPTEKNTMIHMQAPKPPPGGTTSNDLTPVAWEYRVPSGSYQVTVGVGDPSLGNDPEAPVVNVEGVQAVKLAATDPAVTANSCSTARQITGTVSVQVTDGLLTVDALGGTNTKLAYVTIDPAPAPVSGLTAIPQATSIGLDWADTAGASGYRVYRSANRPVTTTGTPLATPTSSEYTDSTAVKGSVYYYAVQAVAGGTVSPAVTVGALIDDGTAKPATFPVQVNFSKQGGTAVAGYTDDYGQNFANLRGYGWVEPGTNNPLNLVGNGRERNDGTVPDKRLDTFMHVQGNTVPNFSNIAQPGSWELSVPNGRYDVEVAVGEPSPGTDPTRHSITVEGTKVVDGYETVSPTGTAKTGADRFTTASAKGIAVADGRLTVDATGGTNTKLDYLTVTPAATTAPAAPTALTATASDAKVTLDWADNPEGDLAGYQVFRGTADPIDTTGTPLSGSALLTSSNYTDSTSANGTAYRYVVRAVNKTGQRSAVSASAGATPAATPPPPPAGCSKISTLACPKVPASLPVQLSFDGSQGGLVDSTGKGTGFTMVDPPSARLAADNPVSNVNVPGYEPSRLSVTSGGLQIRSTKGIAYRQPADSAGTNSQLNTLGVGVAAAGKVLDLTTTVRGIDFPVASNAEQGGLWFGLDEDNYVKLVVFNAGNGQVKVQLLREVGAQAIPSTTYELDSATFAGNQDVVLGLHVDGRTHRVSATYRVASGPVTALTDTANTVSSSDQPVPAAFTDGVTLSDKTTGPVSFAGLYATSRNNTDPATYAAPVFAGFSVREQSAAPAAPTGLRGVAGDNAVTVLWNASPETDLTGYRLYRSTTTPVALTAANLLASPAKGDTTYRDGTATNGTAYHYVLTAVASGGESAGSTTADATPQDMTAPAVPQGLAATAGPNRVALSWTAVTDADLAGYRLYRSATSPVALVAGNRVAEPTDPTYTDSGRTAGTKVYYAVTSIDQAGNESAGSTGASATPTAPADTTPPAAPTKLVAAAGDGKVSLSWTGVGDADLAGYRVLRSAVAGGQRTELTKTVQAGTTYVDDTVANDTAYYYAVVAVDTSDNRSPESNEATATPKDTTPPAAPTGVTATAGANSVMLRWASNTEPDLFQYLIYRNTTTTVPVDRAHLVGTKVAGRTAEAFLDSGLDAGRAYSYVIVAEDQVGNLSGPSTVATATPTAPRDTTAPASPAGLAATVDGSAVQLSWSAVSDSDLAGYLVFRSDRPGGTRTQLTATPQVGVSYTDSTAPAGASSYYVVTAVDTSNNQSAPSNEATAAVPAAGVHVKLNFQPAGAAPAGYTAETGQAFDVPRGYGWVTETSLAGASHTPLDLTGNTRIRGRAGIDPRLDTILHMHYGDLQPPGAKGDLTPGAFEYTVPNGRYTVTVAVGDQVGTTSAGCASPCYDSQHTIHVEGVTAVNAFQGTAAAEYKTATVTVDVTDGRLTVDALGSNNTKINYLHIDSAGAIPPDTQAPGAPTNLTAQPGSAAVSLSWGAPADQDVAGYNVYRGIDATVTSTSGAKVNTGGLVDGTSFTDSMNVANGTHYYYVVTAVDTAGNVSPDSKVADATPAPSSNLNLKVNFQDDATTPPSGYLRDFGQPYGARTDAGEGTGLTYGWVDVGASTPLSLVGNGRNRNTGNPPANQADLRLATFLHMQLPANATSGVTTPGSWELAVPNGVYTVQVAVGDAGPAVDSENWLAIEDQNALAAVVPTANSQFATATRTVVVADGRLTVSPVNGTNTKIDYVDVASVDRGTRPAVAKIAPGNGASAVVTNIAPTADLQFITSGVKPSTVVSNVTLTKVSDGSKVAGVGATSGGADTLAFKSDAVLAASTLYRFDVLPGATDEAGHPFLPFSSVFTTGTTGGATTPGTTAAFDKLASGASAGKSYTSLVVGPDGKLYAGSIYGQIYRWTINTDGTLADETVINTVRTHATTHGWEGAPNRTVIGLTFDPASTPTNPILWITDNYAYLGQAVPDSTGSVARLSGANLENYQEVVVNLPRSVKDHETNSLAFHNGKLYIMQGSMNAMGAPDGAWANRSEHLLSAAILQLDPSKLAALPLDVGTPDVSVPARDGGSAHQGSYSPYAAGAPLTLYATGVRNGFDLVWHSNGHLYTGVNGSAAGGNSPATPASYPVSCINRTDGGYSGPSAPAINSNPQAETDYIFDVQQGKYYGHPNPTRCEYVLNAGNPNGYTGNPLFKTNAYPQGQAADPNYDLAHISDAGLHASADGAIEYKNKGAFGGSFAGKLVVVRYSANQEVVAFDVRSDGSVGPATTGIAGFTGHKQPLDVAEDVSNGNLYVSQLTDNPGTTGILLLKPQGGSGPATGSAQVTPRLVFTQTKGGTSAAQSVTVKNAGNGALTISKIAIAGTDAARFTSTATTPITVGPGATASIPVTFSPTVAGPQGATLTLTTDDPRNPTVDVVLRGLGVLGKGGSLEPSLQWVLDTLQIPVTAGDPDPTNNDMPSTSAAIGDEVLVSSFTKLESDHPVTVTPIALFGPDGPGSNPYVATAGVHTTGKPTERTTLYRGPNTANQTVLPAGDVGEYDLDTPFGFDFTFHGLSDRTAFSEDALNTWGGSTPHKVRVYPLKNASGTVEPGAYVIAPEDIPSPVDYQDAVLIVRNIKPAGTSSTGTATAAPSELVFSGVRGSTSAAQQVTVTNGGTATLGVTGVGVTGPAAGDFTSGGSPQSLAPGASASFTARFTPAVATALGTRAASLHLTTDSTATPTLDVALYGLATKGEQGDNEPPLQDVVTTLGRTIDVGGSQLILGTGAALIGDEVAAPLFTRSGTGPVGIKAIARYSPDELLPFGWYSPNTGDPVTHPVATIDRGQDQTLNPATVAGGASSFDPGAGSFGIYVDSQSFNRKTYTQEGLNTGPTKHAVRTYPAKDRAGKALPNTYVVAFEDATNGDYQDYVFEVSGVQVAGTTGGGPLARINFQPAGTSVVTGYTVDSGAPYSASAGSGWVHAGTSTPQDMSAQTRDRTGSTDPKLRTLVLMQPTAAQSPNGDGAWEYAVPNGSYTVTVGVGDPDYADSVHTVRVEGQSAVSGFQPVAGALFRTGTVTVPVSDGRLTVDAIGGTNTKLEFVDIDRVATTSDTTPPTVAATVSGLQQSAGVYKNTATVTVTASDSGSGVASTSYSLDGGAFTPYTAPVQVTQAGSHTVKARAQDVAGNIATSATTTFSVVAAAVSRAHAVLENLDGAPYADRLAMNRIQSPQDGKQCKDRANCDPNTGPFVPANVVHDVATLRINNTGTDALNVTDLVVSGPFQLAGTTAPALVPAGGSLDIPVRFTATSAGSKGGLWSGSLTISSDDPAQPSLPVELAGFWQSVSEGGQEPGVEELARLFGYGTAITSPGVPLNQDGLVNATGDEVLSPYWLRADGTQPVGVRQLAAFHTQGNGAGVNWYPEGSGGQSGITSSNGLDGQSILPHRAGSSTAYAVGSFTPTTPFGFKVDSENSDDTKNDATPDRANGCPGPCGHHVRFWPIRDRVGAIVPNTWFMVMDYSGINYDYNDNVYLISNMKPERAPDPSAAAPLPGAPNLLLGFDRAYPGTLVDRNGATTGFASTQPNKNDTSTGSSSYDKSLLAVDTTGAGTLAVTSSGTASAGTNGAADNTLVNGLRNAFDATGGQFSVAGRLLGPVTMLDAGSEQEGVMLGPDQDNFVKVVAINKGGVPSLEFYAEQGGAGATQGSTVTLPAGVTALDLALVGDPATRTVKAAYQVNGGTWTVLPATLTLPATSTGRFFARQAQAGVLVSHKGGAQFTASYDSFAVTAGDVTGTTPAGQPLYRLDVAGAGNYTDTSGNVWSPDTGRFSPSTAIAEGGGTSQEIAGTDDDELYRTYRGNVGNVPQNQRVLSYTLPTKGATTVDVRLLFAERAAGNNAPGKRVFDIEAQGKTVRSGFDIFASAGGQNTATALSFKGVATPNGRLDLTFRASVDYPSIAAIEVLCPGTCPADTTPPATPTGVTATAGSTGAALDWADNTESDLLGYDVLRATSANGAYTKLTGTPVAPSQYTDSTAPARATLYYQIVAVDSSENASAPSAPVSVTTSAPPVQQPVRINTGGPAQTVGSTSWSACSSVTDCSGWVSGGFAYAEPDTITGIPAGLNNTIFQSEWTGGNTDGVQPGQRAFGFDVPVVNGSYQVRLHFAELNKFAPRARLFNVNIEGARVLTDLDVYAAAGGADKAIVRSFTTAITDGKVTIDFLTNVENAKISAIEILPLDTTAPDQVTGVTATGADSGITVGWTGSSAADLAGYNVYRADTPTGTYGKVNGALVTGTRFVDPAARAGAASSYQVTAVDTAGNESVRSATASATRPGDTTPPGAVTGVSGTGTAGGNALTWAANAAPDLAGYRVYASDTPGGTYRQLTTAVLTGTSYTDATAPQGAPRSYQVTAVDAAGNESVRSATFTVTRPDTTAPDPVTGLSAAASGSGITLQWTASPASDLAGYDVYRATGGSAFSKLNTALLNATSYVDSAAPAGDTATYRVTASDRSGNTSAPSATASATRPGAPVNQAPIRVNTGGPAVSTGGVSYEADRYATGGKPYTNPQVGAVAGTTDDVLYQSEHSATTDRGAFRYDVPVVDGTYDVTLRFAEIYWGATGGGPGGTGHRVFSVNLQGGPVEVTNLDLNAVAAPMTAVNRTFRVTVSGGALTMEFSASVDQPKISAFEIVPVSTAPADTTAPAAPTGVTATGSPSGVQVRWAANTESDLAGYNLYRSNGTGFVKLNAAVLTSASYNDTAAPTGASGYRVTAVDRTGNESTPSATVSAPRPAPAQAPIRINAGGPAQQTGRGAWSACSAETQCSGWVTGGFAYGEDDTITGVPADMNQALFQTEWTGGNTNGVQAGQRAFGFDVPVANGNYTVRLHFAELNKFASGTRVFDVNLEGKPVLTGFDIYQAAGLDKVVTREFPVTITDGHVNLDFIRQVENAKISAIEILPS